MRTTPTTTTPPDDSATEFDRATREAMERAKAGELLSGTELAAILRIKHARFHVLAKLGEFDIFLVKPAIGTKCYSGVKIWRYICGDSVYEPTFGRKRRA